MNDLPETALGVHFYLDHKDLDPTKDLDDGAKFVRDIRCRWTNVTAASKFDLGMNYIQRLRHENPRLKIIWRAWNNKYGLGDDTDIWQHLSPQEWYNKRVTPFLDFIQKTGCYVMMMNESLRIPVSHIADWQAKVMEIGHPDGVLFAGERDSTGTPPESQYPLLKPFFCSALQIRRGVQPERIHQRDSARRLREHRALPHPA